MSSIVRLYRRTPTVAGIIVVALAGCLPPRASRAQRDVRLGSDATLTISGILSGTVFAQDARFGLGNGQQAEFVQTELDGWWHGGDVRSTRLTFGFRGPSLGKGWRANATLEADFFGPFNGTGNFADEQPTPRLRLAYADLTNGSTTVRVGQAWSLTLGNIPVSASHIGFPLGWGSGGFIGWRFPGIFLIQSLTDTTSTVRARLSLAAMRGSWSDETAPDQPSAGEAGTPQFEGALNLDGSFRAGTWGAYLVGHWDRKDLNNVREEGAPEPAANDLDSWAVEGGLRFQSGAITLHGNAYRGKAMGHQFAHVIQFGDIEGWGAWAQAGVDLTRQFGVWVYYGTDDPDDDDARANGSDRLSSWLFSPMLRFKAGPYTLGLEWLYNGTDYSSGATTSAERKGNQIALSTRFDF
jgi:hypothetical protein